MNFNLELLSAPFQPKSCYNLKASNLNLFVFTHIFLTSFISVAIQLDFNFPLLCSLVVLISCVHNIGSEPEQQCIVDAYKILSSLQLDLLCCSPYKHENNSNLLQDTASIPLTRPTRPIELLEFSIFNNSLESRRMKIQSSTYTHFILALKKTRHRSFTHRIAVMKTKWKWKSCINNFLWFV